MPAKARAAQRALAWVEAILSVVCRACRMSSAMEVSSRGRLVMASRCYPGSASRVNRFHRL
jgi:hypothetical protein